MSPRERVGDLITGAVLIGLTLVGFWRLYGNQYVHEMDFGTDPGPGLFPRLLLWGLGLSGTWLIVRAAGQRRQGDRAEESFFEGGVRRLLLPLLMVASLAGYVLALPRLGFLPLTLAFGLAWVFLLTLEESARLTAGRLLRVALEASLLSGVIYFVFAKLVKVPLP